MSVENTCTGLPSAPYTGVVEYNPFYLPTLDGSPTPDNPHGWGVLAQPPPSVTVQGWHVAVEGGAWGDCSGLPAGTLATGCGDAWPYSAQITDSRRGLASLGWWVFSPGHRPPSVTKWPAAGSDTACAVRWMAAFMNGAACGGGICADGITTCSADSDCAGHGASAAVQANGFVDGESSGAHLDLMAIWATSLVEDGTCPLSGTMPTVKGTVPWSGAYDFNTLYACSGCTTQQKAFIQQTIKTLMGFPCDSTHQAACAAASPVSYVSVSNPPAFVWHDGSDLSIPSNQASELAAFATDGGIGNITVSTPNTGLHLHAPSLWNPSATYLGCTVRDNFFPNPM